MNLFIMFPYNVCYYNIPQVIGFVPKRHALLLDITQCGQKLQTSYIPHEMQQFGGVTRSPMSIEDKCRKKFHILAYDNIQYFFSSTRGNPGIRA